MLGKHVSTTPGSSRPTSLTTPTSGSVPSPGLQIHPMPGTLRSAGSYAETLQDSPISGPSQVARIRKTRSLRETIVKTVGTFLDAHADRQREAGNKHLSEPVLRPLYTTAILQRERQPTVAPSLSEEPQDDSSSAVDNLSQLIKNAVTCEIHRSSLLSLRGEAAADTLLMMQEMLDDPVAYGIESCRYTIRRFLIKLSKESRILPSTLFLVGVVCWERESVNGGSYADIYSASLKGHPVALKRLRVFRVVVDKESRELNAAFFREALVWRQLRHPHILPFWGIDRHTFRPYLCMVSPYMENGNIATYIEQLEEAKENVPRERWATEIARGLQYLHQEQVVHGDLRGANILVDSDMHVRLADFGLSMLVDSNPLSSSPSRNGGAGRWSAPELIQGSQVSFKSDIWAFACVCIQIYTRLPPFGHLSDWQVIRHIMDGDLPEKPPPDTGIRQYLLNLLDMCLKPDPKARPNASSLVRVLSRCSPVPEKRVTMELAPARQKPLPATPPDTDSDVSDKSATPPTNEQEADSDASAPSSSTHSRNPSDEALHVLHHRHHLASMSPLSQQSFVIVPSTPSSNSLDLNVFLPSSPSHSHSIESNIVVSGPSSACSHVSHFPSSPSASSDVSSGYDMVVDANAVDVGSQCYLYL